MCGYSGIVFHENQTLLPWLQNNQSNRFISAANLVSHRGNDDAQSHFGKTLWLHHFRLAFQDVALGKQPFFSPDKRFVIVFNGEIYNHLLLRKKIEEKIKFQFQTRSDTETLMAAFLAFGKQMVPMLEGEFSFVICATDGTSVFAARDFFGVKPLFFALEGVDTAMFAIAKKVYNFTSPSLHFSSEIKGLAFSKTWNREGLLRQFVGLYEPIRTPFNNIIQLPPGGTLSATKNEQTFFIEITTKNVGIRAQNANSSARSFNFQAHSNNLTPALGASVQNRLLSDVELGVYLSGGIDSKAVGYELAKHYRDSKLSSQFQKPKSFTIGFTERGFDESAEALSFAKHFGFDAHVFFVNNEALAYSYPHAVYASENVQPYTNGAAKWWLSKFARQYVHGVLTGDGSDEIFGGYPSFRYSAFWKFAMRARTGKTVFEKLNTGPMGSRWRDSIYIKKFLSMEENPWVAGSSAAGNGSDFIASLLMWNIPHPLFGQVLNIASALLGEESAQTWLANQGESLRSWYAHGIGDNADTAFLTDPENSLLLWQNYFCNTHLPVQVLNWVGDRMEMANTLEGRTPFLSREIRELVIQLPDVALVAGLQDKAILRRSYSPLLTKKFALTPKRQFGAPFLNIESLIQNFKTNTVFEDVGLCDNNRLSLLRKAMATEKNAFKKDHLSQTLQTAVCLSVVNTTLVNGHSPESDLSYESQVTQRVSH